MKTNKINLTQATFDSVWNYCILVKYKSNLKQEIYNMRTKLLFG